jgi:dTDP-4-dehydrorhamnose 3,5-epimerase
MIVEHTSLPGLVILKPAVFRDARGWFFEPFNVRTFQEATGADVRFLQDNESCSSANVLRGLHYQEAPHTQGKLVRVIQGAVLDVCVDIRPESATFGRHFSIRLTGDEKTVLWIPAGFAHGILTLGEGTVFSYKCTAFYHRPSERTILWNDPDLNIDWGTKDPVLSDKDRAGMRFAEFARAAHQR